MIFIIADCIGLVATLFLKEMKQTAKTDRKWIINNKLIKFDSVQLCL